jgi:hypothetical protein
MYHSCQVLDQSLGPFSRAMCEARFGTILMGHHVVGMPVGMPVLATRGSDIAKTSLHCEQAL